MNALQWKWYTGGNAIRIALVIAFPLFACIIPGTVHAEDTEAPVISGIYPPDGHHVFFDAFRIAVKVYDDTDVATVTVNGDDAEYYCRDIWKYPVTLLPGTNDFTIIATDAAGNEAGETVQYILSDRDPPDRDRTGPEIVIETPEEGLVTTNETILAAGTASDESGVLRVMVNREPAEGTETWQASVKLWPGINCIRVAAFDLHTNVSIAVRHVIRTGKSGYPLVYVSPRSGFKTRRAVVLMQVKAFDPAGIAGVTINQEPAARWSSNVWRYCTMLDLGTNEFTVIAAARDGRAETQTVTYIRFEEISSAETNAPILTVTAPGDWAVTNVQRIKVYGTVTDDSRYVRVLVNSLPAHGCSNWHQYVILRPGTNEVTVTAYDRYRNSSTVLRHVVYTGTAPEEDSIPPEIRRTFPEDGFETMRSYIPVYAVVYDNVGVVNVTVNGVKAEPIRTSIWRSRVVLAPGTNTVEIIARDAAGNEANAGISIIRTGSDPGDDTTPPELTVVAPGDGITVTNRKVLVTGTACDDSGVLLVTVNDITAKGTTNWMQWAHLDPGTNQVTVTAWDYYTNSTEQTLHVICAGVWSQKFEILTYEMPIGYVGKPYSFRLMSRGGAGPVHWSTEDALPDNLDLSENGQVHGTPSITGKFEITIVATDAMGRSVTAVIDIIILDDAAMQNLLVSCLPEVSAGVPCTIQIPLRAGATIRTSECKGFRVHEGGRLTGMPEPGIHKLELETEQGDTTQVETLFWNVTEPGADTLYNFRIRKLTFTRERLVFAARGEWSGKPALTPVTPVVFELGGYIAVAEEGILSRNSRRYRAAIRDGERDIVFKLKHTPGNDTIAITVIVKRHEGIFGRASTCSEKTGRDLRLYGKVMIGHEIIHIAPLVKIKESAAHTHARFVK